MGDFVGACLPSETAGESKSEEIAAAKSGEGRERGTRLVATGSGFAATGGGGGGATMFTGAAEIGAAGFGAGGGGSSTAGFTGAGIAGAEETGSAGFAAIGGA